MNKLSAADRARVEKEGWVDCSLTKDGKCWPYWQSRIQYYWPQRFKAGAAVEVKHTYRPVVGGGWMARGDDVDSYSNYLKPYCAGTDAQGQIGRKLQLRSGEKGDGSAALSEREIQYILTTASSWSGSIRSFRLSVISDNPDDIVLTCLPDLNRVAPTRYELVKSNFHPDRELDLLILQRPK
jgi:hypothetical protein